MKSSQNILGLNFRGAPTGLRYLGNYLQLREEQSGAEDKRELGRRGGAVEGSSQLRICPG